MNEKRSTPGVEALEGRVVLSAAGAAMAQGTVEVASVSAHKAATSTTMTVSAGTLGQPVTFSVTVRAPASAGSPAGTVNIVDHGQVIATATLTPTTSSNAKYAYSTATATFTPQAGGAAYYFGKHTVTAEFIPGTGFAKSSSSKSFDVSVPTLTTLSDGTEYATVATGSGPEIQSGQTASVFYTGYLAKNGKIFDDSVDDGGTPFSYTLGAGQVIPGFDAGTAGMQVGETRVVVIPPAEGYGSTASGPIPANSTLVFVITLESIS